MTVSVAFLLGAGFSAPFDIPTMRPFLASFREMAQQKYPKLNGTLERHFSTLPDDSDLEALLSSLGKAERLLESAPPGAPVPQEFTAWRDNSRYLKSHLISYIIERCERFNRNLAIELLSPSMNRLNSNLDISKIHLFTTNYDRIIEHVCDVSGIAYTDGFGSSSNELVAPWNRKYDSKVRLYKLHGSVSYYVDLKDNNSPLFLRLDRGYPLPGPDFRLSREGHELEPLMVLPTLEKNAMGDPYSYLNHVFTETVSSTVLLVAIGTSLRDNHLVSAINYNANDIVVLIVDREPGMTRQRIPNVSCVELKTGTRDFFANSIDRLIEMLTGIDAHKSKDHICGQVSEFASNELGRLSHPLPLTQDQLTALQVIRATECDDNLLTALQDLRGIPDDIVVEAIVSKSALTYPGEVRKAVAASIGLSGNAKAPQILEKISLEDTSSDVRLEAYLALESIGDDVAYSALQSAKQRWPDDTYFRQ